MKMADKHIGLKIMSSIMKDWLKHNKENRDKEGLETYDGTAIMTIPCGLWPSHGQLETWVKLLDELAEEQPPVFDPEKLTPEDVEQLKAGPTGNLFVIKDQWQNIDYAPIHTPVIIANGDHVYEATYNGVVWSWYDSEGRQSFIEGYGPDKWQPLPTPPGGD